LYFTETGSLCVSRRRRQMSSKGNREEPLVPFLAQLDRPCSFEEIDSTVACNEEDLRRLQANHKVASSAYQWGDGTLLRIYWATSPCGEEERAILQAEIQRLNQELLQSNTQEYDKEIVLHMNRLHDYNDLKDTAQMLMGQLAVIEGVLTRDLYKRYHLDLED